MLVEVAYGSERLALEVAEDHLVAAWSGPAGLSQTEVAEAIAATLATPSDFPTLRRAVVPGDRVVIALGSEVPSAAEIIAALCGELGAAGVLMNDVTVLAEPDRAGTTTPRLPLDVRFERHDPADRSRIAYLANTAAGRRIYLDRQLTDADAVIAVGRLRFDPILGYGGPWSVIYPGLSDAETRDTLRRQSSERRAEPGVPAAALRESAEVGWLLGCQFQVGVLPGVTGLAGLRSGLAASISTQGSHLLDQRWSVRPESRAELVVAGVGHPDHPATVEDLATALSNATRLVQRGGKIALLSQVAGPPGPALQRLRGIEDPKRFSAALAGHEGDRDFFDAQRIAQALAWADVYVLSRLDADLVDDLTMIPLDRPEEVRRLVAVSRSTTILSQADRVRADVTSDAVR